MSFTKPGISGAWLTNSYSERQTMESVDEIVGSQAFADGATYSYAYDLSTLVDGEIPQIAGGQYVDPARHSVTIRYEFPVVPASMNPPRVIDRGYPYVNYGDGERRNAAAADPPRIRPAPRLDREQQRRPRPERAGDLGEGCDQFLPDQRPDRQSHAPCATTGAEVRTAYDYGPDDGSAPNNLLLRGQAITADGVAGIIGSTKARRVTRPATWGNRLS